MGQGSSSGRKYDYDKKIVEGKIVQMYFINKNFNNAMKDEKEILKMAKRFGGKSGDKGYKRNTGRRDVDIEFSNKVKAERFKLALKKVNPKIKYYANMRPPKILIMGRIHKMPKLKDMN